MKRKFVLKSDILTTKKLQIKFSIQNFKFFLHFPIGQEDATIDIDDGITITPFNMKEEMEEGHFDTEGMYIFKKDKVLK